MRLFKNNLSEYTESEFLELIQEICGVVGTEEYQDELLEHFIEVTGCAAASDWIYYPQDDADDSAEGIVQTVKAWRAANSLPGFKDA